MTEHKWVINQAVSWTPRSWATVDTLILLLREEADSPVIRILKMGSSGNPVPERGSWLTSYQSPEDGKEWEFKDWETSFEVGEFYKVFKGVGGWGTVADQCIIIDEYIPTREVIAVTRLFYRKQLSGGGVVCSQFEKGRHSREGRLSEQPHSEAAGHSRSIRERNTGSAGSFHPGLHPTDWGPWHLGWVNLQWLQFTQSGNFLIDMPTDVFP